MSDKLDTFDAQIEELTENMQSDNNKINEDINSLQEFDQTVTDNLNNLADDIVNLDEQTQLELAALQQNVTHQGVSIGENTDDINQLQETVEDYDELIQANSDDIEALERFAGSLSNTVDENTIIMTMEKMQ